MRVFCRNLRELLFDASFFFFELPFKFGYDVRVCHNFFYSAYSAFILEPISKYFKRLSNILKYYHFSYSPPIAEALVKQDGLYNPTYSWIHKKSIQATEYQIDKESSQLMLYYIHISSINCEVTACASLHAISWQIIESQRFGPMPSSSLRMRS